MAVEPRDSWDADHAVLVVAVAVTRSNYPKEMEWGSADVRERPRPRIGGFEQCFSSRWAGRIRYVLLNCQLGTSSVPPVLVGHSSDRVGKAGQRP